MAITTLNLRALNRSDTATSGQVITATSATAMDFQTASSADLVKIATVNASGSSDTITVDNCFTADYRNYLIYCTLYPATSGQQAAWRLRTGGASGTSVTAGYYMANRQNYKSSSAASGSDTGTWNGASYQAQESADNDEDRPIAIQITVFDPYVAARDTVYIGDWGLDTGSTMRNVRTFGLVETSDTAVTGCECVHGSGNYRSHSKITVYGIKE